MLIRVCFIFKHYKVCWTLVFKQITGGLQNHEIRDLIFLVFFFSFSLFFILFFVSPKIPRNLWKNSQSRKSPSHGERIGARISGISNPGDPPTKRDQQTPGVSGVAFYLHEPRPLVRPVESLDSSALVVRFLPPRRHRSDNLPLHARLLRLRFPSPTSVRRRGTAVAFDFRRNLVR